MRAAAPQPENVRDCPSLFAHTKTKLSEYDVHSESSTSDTSFITRRKGEKKKKRRRKKRRVNVRIINNQHHFHLQPTLPKIRIYRFTFEQTNKNKTQQKATLTKSISLKYTRDGKGTDSYRLCSLLHWLDILNRVQV